MAVYLGILIKCQQLSLQFIRQSSKPQNNLFTELGFATCSEVCRKQRQWLGTLQISQLLLQQNTVKERKKKILVTLLGSFISLEYYKKQRRETSVFKPNEESN